MITLQGNQHKHATSSRRRLFMLLGRNKQKLQMSSLVLEYFPAGQSKKQRPSTTDSATCCRTPIQAAQRQPNVCTVLQLAASAG
jgi:hypothetical protein